MLLLLLHRGLKLEYSEQIHVIKVSVILYYNLASPVLLGAKLGRQNARSRSGSQHGNGRRK